MTRLCQGKLTKDRESDKVTLRKTHEGQSKSNRVMLIKTREGQRERKSDRVMSRKIHEGQREREQQDYIKENSRRTERATRLCQGKLKET